MSVVTRWLLVLLSIALFSGLLLYVNQQHLSPVINRHTLVVDNPTFYRPNLPGLRIAVISDLHVEETAAAYQALDSLIDEIASASLIVTLPLTNSGAFGCGALPKMPSGNSTVLSMKLPARRDDGLLSRTASMTLAPGILGRYLYPC